MSVRTVKRDLAALDRSGVPVWSRPGPGGGYGIVRGSSLPPINLTSSQAVALLAAVSTARDAPFADQAQAAVQKILDVLDPHTRDRATRLADRVWVNHRSVPRRSIQSPIEQAMTDQMVVRIHYSSGEGAVTIREVEPVLFAARDGHWYLIGWCRLRDAMRWFRLDRVDRAVLTSIPCSGHTVEEVGEPPATARAVHGRERVEDASVAPRG